MKLYSVTIQMKAIKQYFHVVLFVALCVDVSLESIETLKRGYAAECLLNCFFFFRPAQAKPLEAFWQRLFKENLTG